MTWRFTIIKDLIETVIEEPVGWDSITKIIKRDPEWHGLVFNFSENNLQFFEEAYWIIKDEYDEKGVDGNLGIRIEWKCDDCEVYELFYIGKLDFQRYQDFCGDNCYVSIGIEDADSELMIKNRMETAVDLTNNKAYDGTTSLTNYAGLGIDIEVPGKALRLTNNALKTNDTTYDLTDDSDWGHPLGTTGTEQGSFFPGFDNADLSEIEPFTPQSIDDYIRPWSLPSNPGDTQIFTYTEQTLLKCIGSSLQFNGRFKGNITYNGTAGKDLLVYFIVAELYPDNSIWDRVAHNFVSRSNFTGSLSLDVDHSFSFTLPSAPIGTRYFFYLRISTLITSSGTRQLIIDTHKETFFKIAVTSLCPPSPTKSYLLHEAASRIIESITNDSYKFKSEYFGRTDSEPYAYSGDGCGSLRALTNGLQLRRAVLQDGSNPKVFISLKDLLSSLNAIDCIGMGIEGANLVSEPIDYFYANSIMFIADGVNEITTTVMNERIWNQFNFGYDKFETESANGLDAIHTKRQYRTAVLHSEGKLEKYSKIIGDGYAIEVTRRKFGISNDWRYDQNIFALCLKRYSSNLIVDQGNITSSANIFDPATVINYAISPIRNAMRWFKWVVQGIRSYSTTKLLFSSGEGNYVAEGLLNTGCINEVGVIAENEALEMSTFSDTTEATPFIIPEKVLFKYPIGLNEFISIAATKYGKIQYRKNDDEPWRYGWIDQLKYSPEEGEAEFSLITCK